MADHNTTPAFAIGGDTTRSRLYEKCKICEGSGVVGFYHESQCAMCSGTGKTIVFASDFMRTADATD